MKYRFVGLIMTLVLGATACGAANAGSENGSLSGSGEVASLESTEGGETATDVDANGEVDTETQLLAFAECLRAEGFDIGDPTVDADGDVLLPRPTNAGGQGQGPPEGFIDAREACSEHLEGVQLGFQGGDQTALQDQLLEFTSCMRDNGFDMPDPDLANGGRGLLRQGDQDDPAYQAAFANCSDILGGFGRGGAGN